MDPDGGIFVIYDNKRQKRFMWEVDVRNNSPLAMASRAVDLFRENEVLRDLIQLKYYGRRNSTDGTLGGIPAVCWYHRREKDLDGVVRVRVKRVFEVGTAEPLVYKKQDIRKIWEDGGFEVDATVADGPDSFKITRYPDAPDAYLYKAKGSLPFSLRDQPHLQDHFKVTIPQSDIYFELDDVLRPAGIPAKDLEIDLYMVLVAINKIETADLS